MYQKCSPPPPHRSVAQFLKPACCLAASPLPACLRQVSDVSFRYGRNPWIFEGLSFGIDLESRICIVGANGSGKTTLLKLMTGALKVQPLSQDAMSLRVIPSPVLPLLT